MIFFVYQFFYRKFAGPRKFVRGGGETWHAPGYLLKLYSVSHLINSAYYDLKNRTISRYFDIEKKLLGLVFLEFKFIVKKILISYLIQLCTEIDIYFNI